jgi:hypothetical protein
MPISVNVSKNSLIFHMIFKKKFLKFQHLFIELFNPELFNPESTWKIFNLLGHMKQSARCHY